MLVGLAEVQTTPQILSFMLSCRPPTPVTAEKRGVEVFECKPLAKKTRSRGKTGLQTARGSLNLASSAVGHGNLT